MEDHNKIWKTVGGKAFKSHYPPIENLALTKVGTSKDTTTKIEVVAFSVPNISSTKSSEIAINQANWTNIALHTIGKQLDCMKDKIHQPIVDPKGKLTSNLHPTDIQPPMSVLDFKLTDKQDDDFMNLLVEKLSKTTLSVLQEELIEQEQSSSDNELHYIQDMETSLHKLEYEPSGLKTYYKRPTPQDLLFEEDFFQN